VVPAGGDRQLPAGLRRKVYSTLRLDAFVLVGVVVRFGGIEVVGKADEVEQIKAIEVVPVPVVPRSSTP
jgi:hypothetical protein